MTRNTLLISLLMVHSFCCSDTLDITVFKHNLDPYTESLTQDHIVHQPFKTVFHLDNMLLSEEDFLSPIQLESHDLSNLYHLPYQILSHSRWHIPDTSASWSFDTNELFINISVNKITRFHDVSLHINHSDNNEQYTLKTRERIAFNTLSYIDHHTLGILLSIQEEEPQDNGTIS